jgi:hypothetical protein
MAGSLVSQIALHTRQNNIPLDNPQNSVLNTRVLDIEKPFILAPIRYWGSINHEEVL